MTAQARAGLSGCDGARGSARAKRDVNVFFTRRDDDLRAVMWHAGVADRIRSLGWTARFNPSASDLSDVDLADQLVGIDALVTTWGTPKLTERALSKADSLRIVAHAAGSVAFVVTEAVWDRGIVVTTANSLMAQRVAEYNVMMTLFGLRRVPEYAGCGDTRTWDRPANRRRVRGIRSSTIGIWGYGDVARHLLKLLRPFEPAALLVCDDYLSAQEAERAAIRKVTLGELFGQSDVVHLLQGLTPETYGAIGTDELRALRDGAVLVNSGRAHLVDTEALLRELQTGRFYVILDVLPEEPLPNSHPLRRLENVFVTPHNAGAGIEHLLVPYVLADVERYFDGEPLEHRIDRERAMHMTQLVPEASGT